MAPANEVKKNSNETSSKSEVNTSAKPIKTVTNTNVTPIKPVTNPTTPSNNIVVDKNVITIPEVNLAPVNGVKAKMLALVVYNGKIYIQSNTELDSKNIKNFLGDKVGRTINSINEWNVRDKSFEELASNIGEQDIYTVKGYDNDFRIMSYSIYKGQEFAQFFDCLNEVSIELNNAVPYNYETVETGIDASRDNNEFREFTLKLKDGLEFKFTAFKNGYVSCGYSNIFFKVKNSVIDKLWQ